MSVYTHLDFTEIAALMAARGYHLESARAASEGIENSNYLLRCVDADGHRLGLVLTLLEQVPAAHVPWFVTLLEGLQDRGLPVPAPVEPPFPLHDRPALLAPWLPGSHPTSPDIDQCRAVGALLARLHACPPPPSCPQDERQVLRTLGEHVGLLPEADRAAALDVLQRWQAVTGPVALLHADLFRDNVLFSDGTITGVLDFYHACVDVPVYDLAVAVNDWCVTADGTPDPGRQTALLEGYGALPADQAALLPLALAVAALRFWLSRARVAAQGPARKDPAEFARIFRQRMAALET